MGKLCIVDTFPDFVAFWARARAKPIDAQIESWASQHMARWPELLDKQLHDYASEGLDWRQVAREKVFPFLDDRLPAMRVAHDNLLPLCAPIYPTSEHVLGFASDAVFVIYVGIGCGAGWATTFHGSPAILFGLENIAECGWTQAPALTGLVAHEIGHLAHHDWRARHGVALGSGPWWQLYEEGFAQRSEHLILGHDTWHQASGSSDEDWLGWCQQHRAWLAAEFLRIVDSGESVRPFFGSWFDIRGHRQCGYFLGHELIKELEASHTLEQIALLDDIEGTVRPILRQFTAQGAGPGR